MLCPEVERFPHPRTCTTVCSGRFDSGRSGWKKAILDHHFNHKVSVVVPNSLPLPQHMFDVLSDDCTYYKVCGVRLEDLVRPKFVDAFVKKGCLLALSLGTRIDNEDCIAILPTGKLHMSLVKDTYEELGLQGKASFFDARKSRKFIVEVDLKSESFVPGKRNHTRVVESLRDRIPCTFNLLVCWEPPDDNICPSSVASYLNSIGCEVWACCSQSAKRQECNVRVPELTVPAAGICAKPLTVDDDEIQGLLEWMGLFALGATDGVQSTSTSGDYLSSYACPEPWKEWLQVSYSEWSGLFPSSRILQLMNLLRAYVGMPTDLGSIPWACVVVHGFDDSPISWGKKEHTFQSNGDNLYMFLILPGGRYVTTTMVSSNKRLK